MGNAYFIVPCFSMNCDAGIIYFNSCSYSAGYRILFRNFHLPFSPHFLSKTQQIILHKTTELRLRQIRPVALSEMYSFTYSGAMFFDVRNRVVGVA